MSCLFLGLTLLVPAARPAADRPNVLVVMTDDQGYGDLSCHGNPVVQTPHLDRLWSESVRFTDFHVAPMCTPTRGQLLTGTDALRNKASNVSSGRALLRADLPTAADHFAAAGYATGLFGKWHLGDNFPYRPQDRGFDTSLWFPSSHINSLPDAWNNDYFSDTLIRDGRRVATVGYCTDAFFGAATEWITSRPPGQPWFCYLATNAAHWPHFVPTEFVPPVRERLKAARDRLPSMSDKQAEELVRFLAMIENIDANFGRLEQTLLQSGLRRDTVVVFLTDNGSTMGERSFNAGMRGKKTQLWEGGHRVPLFVRWPGGDFGHPRDVPGLTHVQDVLPTLLELCGVEATSEVAFDGISLGPQLRGREDRVSPDRRLVINYSRMPGMDREHLGDRPSVPQKQGAAVLWQDWRLLYGQELYDLAADPLQTRDVASEHPAVVASMRRTLDEWWDGLPADVLEPERVVIGHTAENPTRLTACEWLDEFVDQQRQVRRLDRKDGVLHVEVAEAGTYRFTLSRYPAEADLGIGEAIPPTPVTDGTYVAGRPLEVASARLRVGSQSQQQPATPSDRSVTFELALSTGPSEVQATFLDAEGRSLVGAYYVGVERLP